MEITKKLILDIVAGKTEKVLQGMEGFPISIGPGGACIVDLRLRYHGPMDSLEIDIYSNEIEKYKADLADRDKEIAGLKVNLTVLTDDKETLSRALKRFIG